MKKNQNYEINFVTKTITVTKQFREDASQIGTDAFVQMQELLKLDMPIVEREIHRKPKVAKWTFARMERYLLNVEDSEKWTADYTALKNSASHAEVWGWFRGNFIQVNSKGKRILPKLNENHQYIVTPKITPISMVKESAVDDVKPETENDIPSVKGA